MGNKTDGAGILSFLSGNRKVSADAEEKKDSLFKSIGAAIRITLLISLLLWWIPIIGQAIAGYVGGRKGGTAAKGMAATLVSVLVLIVIITVLGSGLIGGFDFINTDPSVAIANIGMDFPVLGTFLALILKYLQAFFAFFTGSTSMQVNIYIITVLFGLIGGTLAELHAKEVARNAPVDDGKRNVPRSLAAYYLGKKLGFGNFDDRIALQQSGAPEQKALPSRSLVRKAAAREEPAALPAGDVPSAAQEAEERESPFAGLIHRAEKNDPEKERVRHAAAKDDGRYI